MAEDVTSQIMALLLRRGLKPTQTWLQTFLGTQRPTTPIPALTQTALFRLIHTDLRDTQQTSNNHIFPPDILDANISARRIHGPIPVQIMDIEDVGRSRWSQIEAIEEADRGETTVGREVIRVVPGEEGLSGPDAASGGKTGPHKVLLQDAAGVRAYGFEITPVKGIATSMYMGAKMVLSDVQVARGVVLLDPKSAEVLGGKLDDVHQAWKESRKVSLRAGIDAQSAPITG